MAPVQGTLLVVEDDFLNRTLLETQLREDGYEVVAARDGAEALECLRARSFDVVLLDLLMPRIGGIEVLRWMKEDAALRFIPVIVISAQEDLDSVIQCIEMGAADYLPKPFEPVLLRARVHASLASKRLRDLELAHLHAIQSERERADRLLLNILPKPIAEQLKGGRRVIAENFPDVTVLFADLVDFTRYASQRTPAEVLQALNTLFSAFDRLTDAFGVEKVKTIGDAYMAVGGLPLPREDHAEAVAHLALAMREEAARLRREQGIPLSLRIGIHSGPVIAGVIGEKKFTYDLWGDTVNTASRMESHGVVDGIHLSDATYARLRERFRFAEKGLVDIKGKGPMRTYLLLGAV
jgi:class 3 adenylate cyclase